MSNGINKEVAREAMSPDPSQLLEFFLIYYAWPDNQFDFIALTPVSNFGKSIIWQEIEYFATTLESSGFDIKGDGELTRPSLSVSNFNQEISKYLNELSTSVGLYFGN